ncbi:cytosolic sulfotransferase 1-like isoform X2 [Euphorbia lathyris]|uniref:cytosolic sulfotransferase 1-like isoform X2 n=1 Tax=Euphorbia lathyris TaxID=212925 RepID=UPI003313436D
MEQDKTFSSSKLVLDVEQQIKELLPSLPKTLEGTITEMAFYEGFWCFSNLSGAVISFQRCFQAQDTDLIIASNPKSVSLWHHYHEMGLYNNGEMSMEDFFDVYFEGVSWYGPYWDHVLGYWKESLEKPNKVLFLKYEDMKKDIVSCLKRIAEFIGYPFSREEDRDGVIEEIVKLCSLSNLKNLEVNIEGMYLGKVPNKSYFRKGKVGEWVDYLSPSKKKHLENVMQEKLRGSGLSFKLSI